MFGKAVHSEINRLLNQKFNDRRVLIAVHRGSSGGNIIENTIPAYNAALRQGADLLEVDAARSADGVLYAFHDGGEPRLLNEPDNITTMDSARVDRLPCYNSLFKPTDTRLARLEQILAYFKGSGTLLNIDRAWDFWPELLAMLDKYEMMNQVVLKGHVTQETLELFDRHSNKYMFMPIIFKAQEIDTVLSYDHINLVGMELIVDSNTDPLFQNDIIDRLHGLNLFVWANAITLDDNTRLFGGLDDDISIIQGPEQGWGNLLEKGVDVIQTDWPALLTAYRDRRLQEAGGTPAQGAAAGYAGGK